MRSVSVVLAVLALLTSPAVAKRTLAVVDLVDKGAGRALCENLTDVVTVALNRLELFDVLSRSDINAMIGLENMKDQLGCEDVSCMAEIGGALGVALLVSGSVGKVGGTYIVNLSLTDTSSARVQAREQRRVEREADLPAEVEGAARFLVRDLLQGHQGYLIMNSSELGADVELDGRLIGVTPIGRQTIVGGPHRVRVSKKGFISFSRDFDINKEEATVLDVSLVPSVATIEDYDAAASGWRTSAYIVGGVGLATLLASSYAYFIYNAPRADRLTDEINAAECAAGGSSNPTVNCEETFGSRREGIEQIDTLSSIGGAVGVVALGVAAYLFLAGPEPGIYDRYKGAGALGFAPLEGGGMVSLTWRTGR